MENREGGSTGFMKNRNVFNWIKTNIKEIGVKSIINIYLELSFCCFAFFLYYTCKTVKLKKNAVMIILSSILIFTVLITQGTINQCF